MRVSGADPMLLLRTPMLIMDAENYLWSEKEVGIGLEGRVAVESDGVDRTPEVIVSKIGHGCHQRANRT